MRAIAWAALLLGSVGVWQVGGRLSADAMAMMVGLIFGGLVAVPVALLTIYAERQAPPWNERSQKTITSNYSEIGRLLE